MIMLDTSPLEGLYQEELYKIDRKVMIIISKPWREITNDENELLEKILGSVKLNLASVQVLECKEFEVEDFKVYGPTSCIISFGALLKGSFKKYEVISEHDSSIIIADKLDELDDQNKRRLWVALKQVFQS